MPDNDVTRLPDDSTGAADNVLTLGQEFGQYKVVDLVGRGGMGEVYAVRHTVLDTKHALKVIRPEILEHAEAPQRFRREAQVMAKLRHENIIQVDDFGTSNGLTWLRMELIEGGKFSYAEGKSLADILEESGPLPEAVVKDLLEQILEGLSFSHQMGVVHRDLKPANLLLTAGGKIKIADFGLVRLAGADWLQSQVQLTVARSMADPDATRLEMEDSGSKGTETRALLGTYEFMSPEQKKGEEADYRSDLYSVGLIVYRMLTGEATMGFDLPSELVDGLDPRWDAWIRKATATRLERRFSDAIDMADAIPGRQPVRKPVKETTEIRASSEKAPATNSSVAKETPFDPATMDSRERSKAKIVFMQSDPSYSYMAINDQERSFEQWLISNWGVSGRVVRQAKPKQVGPTPEELEKEAKRLEEARKQVGGDVWKKMLKSDLSHRYMPRKDQIKILADWLEKKV